MIRAGNGAGNFLYSKVWLTQVYPLVMVVYGLGILPLIRELYTAYPSVTQPWYADSAGLGGTFKGIRSHIDNLIVRGHPRGYFPDITKSILVMSPWNIPRAEAFFWGYGL